MNDRNDERIRELLQRGLARTSHELRRDLWPQMLARLDAHPAVVPWFDWALLAAVALCLLLVPNAVPLLLYHL